ncbi:hypothetical protein AK812_SmicGene40405 [Symbiodinium microadriaticum]|uniref:Uncharacterized protein n=1 Tax=Symbiodinium microadriaticum TaxID=2951 RepID=A0A1Q9C8S2_SYMMI|nr:hypothetical protein AK812_SmicGene40405 [Symbiodinium microadriaticum]
MDLRPINQLFEAIAGDLHTLPMLSQLFPLELFPYENVIISSEDIKSMFYIVGLPESWKPLLAFGREVPDFLKPKGVTEPCVLTSRVLPMGFINSVAVAQCLHRNIVNQAVDRFGLSRDQEIRKDQALPAASLSYRVYLDNFDSLYRTNREAADLLAGSLSPLSAGLREVYEELKVPINEKKSVKSALRAEMQGGLVDGIEGIIAPKADKIARYLRGAWYLLQSKSCDLKRIQMVAGGLVYLFSYRRCLMSCLNEIWCFISSFEGKLRVWKVIPPRVKMEISSSIALSPLAYMDLRCEFDPVVAASDASESGGGLSYSSGLTQFGVEAMSKSIRGLSDSISDDNQVFVVSLFDGIGTCRAALDLIGAKVAGYVAVEPDDSARRVVECAFGSTEFFTSGTLVTDEVVKRDYSMQTRAIVLVQLASSRRGHKLPCFVTAQPKASSDNNPQMIEVMSKVANLEYMIFCKALWKFLQDDMKQGPAVGRNISPTYGPVHLLQEDISAGLRSKGHLGNDGHYFVTQQKITVAYTRPSASRGRGPGRWRVYGHDQEGALPAGELICDDVQVSTNSNSFDDIVDAVRQERNYAGISSEDVMRRIPRGLALHPSKPGPVTISEMVDPEPGPSLKNALPKRDKIVQICQSDEMFTWVHALATILVINEKAFSGGLKVHNLGGSHDCLPSHGTDGMLTIALGEGDKYRVLPKITGFFGIISSLFKRLWDQAEMHDTLETDDNFEIVASTIKAIYDQTCRSCGLINRLVIYMPTEGKQVRKMRIDHIVGDTAAKQKWLRPDKRQSEALGLVSDKRQKDEAYDNYQNAWIAEHELIAQWEAPLNLSTLSTPYDLPEPSSHRRYCKVLSLKTMKGEEGGCVAAVAMKRPAGKNEGSERALKLPAYRSLENALADLAVLVQGIAQCSKQVPTEVPSDVEVVAASGDGVPGPPGPTVTPPSPAMASTPAAAEPTATSLTRGERNRKLVEDGCIVAAREERLLDIWCRKLQEELLQIDAPILAALKGSLDPDRAALLLIGRTRASTLKRYLSYYRQWRLWLAEAKLRYPPGRPTDLVDYLLARRDEPCGRSVPEAILKAISWVEKVAEFPQEQHATHGRLAWAAKDKITEIFSERARLIKRAPRYPVYLLARLEELVLDPGHATLSVSGSGDVGVHRRAFQPSHGLAPRHSEPNHAIALGEFSGGRVWIEDDEGDSTAWLEDKKGGRELRGRWLDMHDKPVSFDARRYHKVEPHEGSMWALAAYVPQAYARATEQHRQALREAGFPLPALS